MVSFVSSPASSSAGPTAAELIRFAVAQRRADDGLHLLWPNQQQIRVTPPFDDDTPLAAVIAFDEHSPARMQAATDVWRTLRSLPPLEARRPSPQTIPRLLLRLRALDGDLAGASHRAIAAGLFGADRVPAGTAWKTDDLRSRTQRLVRDGRALMRGGYLHLLR